MTMDYRFSLILFAIWANTLPGVGWFIFYHTDHDGWGRFAVGSSNYFAGGVSALVIVWLWKKL